MWGGVRPGKPKEILSSASSLALREREKKKKAKMAVMDTGAREGN